MKQDKGTIPMTNGTSIAPSEGRGVGDIDASTDYNMEDALLWVPTLSMHTHVLQDHMFGTKLCFITSMELHLQKGIYKNIELLLLCTSVQEFGGLPLCSKKYGPV